MPNWEAIGIIGGLGAAGLGALLGSRAQGQANQISQQNADRLFGLADAERARRDQLQGIMMPFIMQGLRQPGGVAGIGGGRIGSTPQPQQQMSAAPYQAPGNRGGGIGRGALTGAGIGMQFGGPIGAGIGAGAGAIGSQFGKLGANEAQDWTKRVQDPLLGRVSGIIDPIDRARTGGTLTPDMLEAAKRQLESEIAGYGAAAGQYRGQGSKQNRVIDQSYQTLNPIFDAWRRSLVL